ncbi:MAG: response regulator transcription factor [Actinomycetia bacterium]|nr:response regulator transcription factor [Actinomycetes bacterium]
MADVLVVEDDDTIGSVLEAGLRANGFRVQRERTGRAALQVAGLGGVDLVLLDLGLPDMDGVDVCRELRSSLPSVVIVILTARTDEMDVLAGLESGADDYLAKPFSIVEVLARVRAHLRRSAASHADGEASTSMDFGALTVDIAARRALIAGTEVLLRAREFDLLARLVRDAGMAVSREALMSDVWDEHWFGSTKTLDVHMVALRRKLSAAARTSGPDAVDHMPQIVTLRGHGYRLDAIGE